MEFHSLNDFFRGPTEAEKKQLYDAELTEGQMIDGLFSSDPQKPCHFLDKASYVKEGEVQEVQFPSLFFLLSFSFLLSLLFFSFLFFSFLFFSFLFFSHLFQQRFDERICDGQMLDILLEKNPEFENFGHMDKFQGPTKETLSTKSFNDGKIIDDLYEYYEKNIEEVTGNDLFLLRTIFFC